MDHVTGHVMYRVTGHVMYRVTGHVMYHVTGHVMYHVTGHVTAAASSSASDCSDWVLCSMSGVTISTNGKAL